MNYKEMGREREQASAAGSFLAPGGFSSRKVCEKVDVARFGFIWQLLSNN